MPNETTQPKVYIVDDDPQVREAVGLLLQSVDIEVESFESAHAFLEGCRVDRPCCLLLDIRMPGISGLELQRRFSDNHIPIIFVTAHADLAIAVEAMKAGACDFIVKPYRPQGLLDRVQHVLEEEVLAWQRQVEHEQLHELFDELSPREYEVLERVAEGIHSKQIAAELCIAPTTVDFHRRNVMKKLNADTLIELGRLFEAHQETITAGADLLPGRFERSQ